jgi:hypothetical protein
VIPSRQRRLSHLAGIIPSIPMDFALITAQALSSYLWDNVPGHQGSAITAAGPREIDRFPVNSAAARRSHNRLTGTTGSIQMRLPCFPLRNVLTQEPIHGT